MYPKIQEHKLGFPASCAFVLAKSRLSQFMMSMLPPPTDKGTKTTNSNRILCVQNLLQIPPDDYRKFEVVHFGSYLINIKHVLLRSFIIYEELV